jgi:uncharacterized protein (UPF0262 family)
MATAGPKHDLCLGALQGDADANRVARVVLTGEAGTATLNPSREADRMQAVADLEAENCFVVIGKPGPYALHLSVHDGRLLLDIRDLSGTMLGILGLALGPFRSLMRDYELMLDSYALAVQEGREARIQAIDMGRRAVHNEAAGLLMQRLVGRIVVDLDTARRLFTLLCALHQRI